MREVVHVNLKSLEALERERRMEALRASMIAAASVPVNKPGRAVTVGVRDSYILAIT
jgi:hypothetical protein